MRPHIPSPLIPSPLTSEEGQQVAAWMDAQRGQVFSAVYSGDRVLEGPVVEKPADVLARWKQRGCRERRAEHRFIGDGALSYRALIERHVSGRAHRYGYSAARPVHRAPGGSVRARAWPGGAGRHSAHLHSPVGCGAGSRPPHACVMNWAIQRTLSDADLDEIVAIEKASFTNPWTREMYLRELQNPDVSFLYVLRVPEAGIVAFCSFWLVLDEVHINNLAVRGDFRAPGGGDSAPRARASGRGEPGGAARHARGSAVERPGAAAVRAARLRSGGYPAELLRQPARRCAYPMERSAETDRTLERAGPCVTFGPDESNNSYKGGRACKPQMSRS